MVPGLSSLENCQVEKVKRQSHNIGLQDLDGSGKNHLMIPANCSSRHPAPRSRADPKEHETWILKARSSKMEWHCKAFPACL